MEFIPHIGGGHPGVRPPKFSCKSSMAHSIGAKGLSFSKYIDNHVCHELLCKYAESALFLMGSPRGQSPQISL